MKKLVLKIDMLDERGKRKAMKTVAGLSGIDSISIDMKERKLTIIGTVDPTKVVSRLRKYWTTELVTVGPAKDPEKDEPKKEDGKKEEGSEGEKKAAAAADNDPKNGGGEAEKKAEESKKEEGNKNEGDDASKANVEGVSGGGGGEGAKKIVEEERKVDPVLEMVKAYKAYNPQMTKYYYVQSMEENPNACVIS